MKHKAAQFASTREVLDDNEYVDCKFKECVLVYQGGTLPTITGCELNDCRWEFEDGAMRTLMLLRSLYHGMGDEGREMVEHTLQNIRRPE